MKDDEWFPLAELTDRLGSLVWVETVMADALDRWSRTEPVAAAAVAFASAAGHHRWHSELLRGVLPTSPQLEAERFIRPPTAGWKSAAHELEQLTASDATAARLGVVTKVLDPWLEREVGALLELSRPVSDRGWSRWMSFINLDHDHDAALATELLASVSSNATRVQDHRLVQSFDLR